MTIQIDRSKQKIMKTEFIGDRMKVKRKVYPCTVGLTMDLVGGKWKAVMFYHLKDQDKRYNELLKEIPSITEMTFSLQLKQLGKTVFYQKVYGKIPPMEVIYGLTDFGKSFVPVLEAITNWGNQIITDKVNF